MAEVDVFQKRAAHRLSPNGLEVVPKRQLSGNGLEVVPGTLVRQFSSEGLQVVIQRQQAEAADGLQLVPDFSPEVALDSSPEVVDEKLAGARSAQKSGGVKEQLLNGKLFGIRLIWIVIVACVLVVGIIVGAALAATKPWHNSGR